MTIKKTSKNVTKSAKALSKKQEKDTVDLGKPLEVLSTKLEGIKQRLASQDDTNNVLLRKIFTGAKLEKVKEDADFTSEYQTYTTS